MADLPETKPVLIRELDYEALKSRNIAIFKTFWENSPQLQEIAPDFDTWIVETPIETVFARFSAFHDMLLIAETNDWARAVLIVYFAFGTDLDRIAESEGLERFEGETDAALQERIVLERRGKYGPGSDPWYVRNARNCDGRVRHVAVTGNGRRIVEIAILSKEGDGTPSAELIEKVQAYCSQSNIRRNNDIITVIPAVLLSVSVKASIRLLNGFPESILEDLTGKIINEWNDPENPRMGKDLTSSWLISRLHISGVYSVALVRFQDIIVEPNRAVSISDIEIEITGWAE